MGALCRVLFLSVAAAFAAFNPRPLAFSFTKAGLSNRFITPNGDGRNDVIVFRYSNPRDILVSGRVVDLKGARVAELAAGTVADTLVWDGKAGGGAVPSGVYIYVIEGGSSVFTGTLVVVR
ncbi:MAG: gliding motility-associated C-terminal domain-containing protein [Elusimicrobia bacterium]|nr:gliding motility-associated C-terminal domain-containing protein [Elusimicrobiota bacterium]